MRKKFALQKRKDIIKFGAEFTTELIHKNGFTASACYLSGGSLNGLCIACSGKDKLEVYNSILKTLKEEAKRRLRC